MEYNSQVHIKSKSAEGVSYTVARVSLGRRIDLARRIREIGLKRDFHKGGNSLEDQLEIGIIDHEINRAYLEWGLLDVSGLEIDGQPATVQLFIDRGPETLVAEALGAVRAELSLTEEERKN